MVIFDEFVKFSYKLLKVNLFSHINIPRGNVFYIQFQKVIAQFPNFFTSFIYSIRSTYNNNLKIYNRYSVFFTLKQ